MYLCAWLILLPLPGISLLPPTSAWKRLLLFQSTPVWQPLPCLTPLLTSRFGNHHPPWVPAAPCPHVHLMTLLFSLIKRYQPKSPRLYSDLSSNVISSEFPDVPRQPGHPHLVTLYYPDCLVSGFRRSSHT